MYGAGPRRALHGTEVDHSAASRVYSVGANHQSAEGAGNSPADSLVKLWRLFLPTTLRRPSELAQADCFAGMARS